MATNPPAPSLAQSIARKIFLAVSLVSGRRGFSCGFSRVISLGLLLTVSLLAGNPAQALSRRIPNADGGVGAPATQNARSRFQERSTFKPLAMGLSESFQPRTLWKLMSASRWAAFAPVSLFNTITVNTTADTVAADGFCSLREAMMAANGDTAVNECPAGAGQDTIDFNLGAGTPIINISGTPLPAITQGVTISGNTGGATRVKLNGGNLFGVGLQINGSGTIVRSLVISNFNGSGILIQASNVGIQNCYLGTDATGMLSEGNLNGIEVNGSANTVLIGVDDDSVNNAFERNVISGNLETGILISSVGAITIAGNYIGTDATGNAALANTGTGILLSSAPNNLIGGSNHDGEGNVISGNSGHGVEIIGAESFGIVLMRNIIGRNADKTEDIPNGGSGVNIGEGASDNFIGTAGNPNVIAGNGQSGVLVASGEGNTISNNIIFGNTGLGINLSDDGVTPNDPADVDSGANALQNFPDIESVTAAGLVTASLDSAPNSGYHIEFFASATCDPSGNGEGEVFRGSTDVTTGGEGVIDFTFNITPVPGKPFITATATDNAGNTSEFSACQSIACGFGISPTVATFQSSGGSGIVAVTASSACSWMAVSNVSWITVTSGSSGTGNGMVGYTVAPIATAGPRSGTLTIAGQAFTVTQTVAGAIIVADFSSGIPPGWQVVDGGTPAVYDNTGTPLTWTTLNPCNQVIPPPFVPPFAIVDASCSSPGVELDEELRLPPFDATGLGSVFVEFYSQFEWAASAPNNKGDLDVSTDGGMTWTNVLRLENGDDGVPTPVLKSINITPYISDNPSNVLVRLHYYGISTPLTPNLRAATREMAYWGVDFGVYSYALTPSSQSFPASGGSGTISVATSEAIPSPQGEWTAVSNDPWITITSGDGTMRGNGMVAYTVAPTTGGPRTGTLTISGRTFTVTQSCIPSPAGLIAWYRAEDNANDQQGTNNGTLQNSANFAAGFVGRAFNFDGVDDYVQTTLDAQPSALPNTTWEAWVYPTRVNHNLRQTIFSTNDEGFDRAVTIEADSVNFGVFTGAGVWQPVAATPNQWQHIAVVYTPGGIEFYKNGVKYIFEGVPSGQATVNRFHIGRNPAAAGEYYQGLVDEVGVYNRALIQAEVQTIVNAGSAGRCGVCPTTTIGPENPTLPAGIIGQPYTQTFTAGGGALPYTFALNTGSLPTGLEIGANGVLSGTPMEIGTFNFTVRATDMNGCLGVKTYALTITTVCGTILISPPSLANGFVGVAYSQQFTQAGGTGTTTFSTASTLPTGITLSSAGLLAGTTNQIGTFPITIQVMDANDCTGTANYTLSISCPAITLSSLSGGTAGTAFNQTLTASPSGSYSFVVTAGSLPPGLSLSGSGALTGTPVQAGTFNFTVTATGAASCTGSRAYSLTINCPGITIAPASLPAAALNTAYGQTVSATPPGTNYTFAVTGGSLPAGLSLSSDGSWNGAPTQSGIFNFRVTATGFGTCTGFRDYTLTVNCPGVTVTPESLPNGMIGTAYSQSVSATPAGTYNFAVTSGALPPGLMLNGTTGLINGTPTTNGSFTFTITASGGAGGCSSSRTYTVAIGCSGISFTVTSLPAGTAGNNYSQTLLVTPAGTYTFSLVQGSLPSGFILNPTTGLLSGLPTAPGTSTFSIKAQAANGCSATQVYSLVINCPSVTLTPATLPNGTTGTAYSQQLSASPAGGNYIFTVTSGALPTGLTLNSATGHLSGTPSANGTFTFTITATGFAGCAGARTYTVVIGGGACPTIELPANLPGGSVGQLYSQAIAATPAENYTYEVTGGSLPPGITLYGSFGLLFGYPTGAGSFTFTVQATNTNGCTASKTYTVTVGGGSLQASTANDFSGDHKSDFVLWRAEPTQWLVVDSATGKAETAQWGRAGDVAVPGDYDGDGKADFATFSKDGHWQIKLSGNGATLDKLWGLGSDVPVPGDYDGDGKTDLAVWRGTEAGWYIQRSSNGQTQTVRWGTSLAPYFDVPVPGDYDGDGKTDVAVFRRGNGHWYVRHSSDGEAVDKAWGLGTDVPVPGDYDGDGKTDIAVWRGAEGAWYIIKSGPSSGGAVETRIWGAAYAPYFDSPVVGDYDGDGKADITVWRKTDGRWYIQQSSDGATRAVTQGKSGDQPVTAVPRF